MFFLRFTVLAIIVLGILIYLITIKIRTEFLKTGEDSIAFSRGMHAEYKAFCENPPNDFAADLVKTRKKLTIAMVVAVAALLLAILLVVIEQT